MLAYALRGQPCTWRCSGKPSLGPIFGPGNRQKQGKEDQLKKYIFLISARFSGLVPRIRVFFATARGFRLPKIK